AIEYLKKTEEAGLVHCASNDTSTNHIIICNCCECCCGALKPTKELQFKTVRPSNFIPKINEKFCVLCESCLEKCPMEAISHSESNEELEIDYNLCIGCGVCASNCVENAIMMEKIQNIIPPRENKMGNRTFFELIQ
ncbi:MAG: 4Fe-4S dicluster domain-containing protein, partial [Promethearchaeota archaeon]